MRRIWRRDHTLQSFVGALPLHLELTAGQPGPVPAMSDAPYIPRISSIYIYIVYGPGSGHPMLLSKVRSESPQRLHYYSPLISPRQLGYACLPTRRGLLVDHGALPYRAAHKAVNPSRADPMLILI